MVTTVTNYGRSGLFDFVAQRVTSILLAVYALFVIGYLVFTPELTYEAWRGLFDHLWMRVFSLLALVSIAVHAWIGAWGVLTDYVTERMMGKKAFFLRSLALSVHAIVIVAYLVWGVETLWGL